MTFYTLIIAEAKRAGESGRPMPDFGQLFHLSKEQMTELNKTYDHARNSHASRNGK